MRNKRIYVFWFGAGNSIIYSVPNRTIIRERWGSFTWKSKTCVNTFWPFYPFLSSPPINKNKRENPPQGLTIIENQHFFIRNFSFGTDRFYFSILTFPFSSSVCFYAFGSFGEFVGFGWVWISNWIPSFYSIKKFKAKKYFICVSIEIHSFPISRYLPIPFTSSAHLHRTSICLCYKDYIFFRNYPNHPKELSFCYFGLIRNKIK